VLICSQECEEVLKEQCPPDLASVQEEDVSQLLILAPNSLHSAGFNSLTNITYICTQVVIWVDPLDGTKEFIQGFLSYNTCVDDIELIPSTSGWCFAWNQIVCMYFHVLS